MHHADLHFLYVCIPMRSYVKDQVWSQLQSAEPQSQNTEATPAAAQSRVCYSFY